MKTLLTLKKVQSLLAMSLLMIAANSHADWQLDQSNSSINFVTIKKGNIAESHTFGEFSGTLTSDKATITIATSSVDTKVDIRNERMREFLFETASFPNISISADIKSIMSNLETGQSSLVAIPATLELHGVTKQIVVSVRVSKLNADSYLVSSSEPVLIRAKDYALLEGVLKLSSLVNNLPIAETVPISFSLQFNK